MKTPDFSYPISNSVVPCFVLIRAEDDAFDLPQSRVHAARFAATYISVSIAQLPFCGNIFFFLFPAVIFRVLVHFFRLFFLSGKEPEYT